MSSPAELRDVAPAELREIETPARLLLDGVASRRFSDVAARASAPTIGMQPAYSVKTNPRPALLRAARDAGFLAETISPAEVLAARNQGFEWGRIIYNGPRACRRTDLDAPLLAAFADSLEAFSRYVEERPAHWIGLRIRPPGIPSRFGVTSAELDAAADVARTAAGDAAFAVSMHVRSEDFRPRTWLEVAELLVVSAATFERRSGRHVRAVDVGGGWTPAALDEAVERDFPRLRALVTERLPHVDMLIFEPGQSITTPCEAIICSVLEVRQERREAVVDAGAAVLPHLRSYHHPLYWLAGDGLAPLTPGRWRILGPLCLEYDVVAEHVALPGNVAPGDRILIADCGSYDASMAFPFAVGSLAATPALAHSHVVTASAGRAGR